MWEVQIVGYIQPVSETAIYAFWGRKERADNQKSVSSFICVVPEPHVKTGATIEIHAVINFNKTLKTISSR